ncbi:SRPBCC family protein [Streptomyces sp. NPDC002851]
MTVTSVDKDLDNLTLTLIADFDAPAERVWQLWADPRQLERWWGPPTWPATFEDHDLTPGGRVTYYMTGPTGERMHGWWKVTSANPPKSLEFVDGFSDTEGNPVTDMPTITMRMQLTAHDGGTRMEMHSSFDSREHMQQLLDMGMEEGLAEAVGQIDALLAGRTPGPMAD